MAQISFKDVGIEDYRESNRLEEEQRIPIGIKTPLELDYSNGTIFKMHFNLPDQISDNLRNLILTNRGERLGFYDFGANIRPILSEFNKKDEFDQEVMRRIKKAVSTYMPFVELIGYESKGVDLNKESIGYIKLLIAYSVPRADLKETLLEVDMYVM